MLHTRPMPQVWEAGIGILVSAFDGPLWLPHTELLHVAIGGEIEPYEADDPLTLTACTRRIQGGYLQADDDNKITWKICQCCAKRVSPDLIYVIYTADGRSVHTPLSDSWFLKYWPLDHLLVS